MLIAVIQVYENETFEKYLVSLSFLLFFPTINLSTDTNSSAVHYFGDLTFLQGVSNVLTLIYDRRLVSSVGRTPVCCAGGRGFEPDRTNTQGLKITEEDVLPL